MVVAWIAGVMSEKPDDDGPDPAARNDFATRSERSTASSRRMRSAQPRGIVLLVDDDPAVRRSVRRMVESDGYEVTDVGDGEEALRLLREGLRPAAILLDVAMPKLNGYQFRVRQLADPGLAQIPTLIVSGEADHPDTSRLCAAGYVSKPFSRNIILAALRAATSGTDES